MKGATNTELLRIKSLMMHRVASPQRYVCSCDADGFIGSIPFIVVMAFFSTLPSSGWRFRYEGSLECVRAETSNGVVLEPVIRFRVSVKGLAGALPEFIFCMIV